MIVNMSGNGQKLVGKQFDFAKYILSFHETKDKLKELNSIIIDLHPEYKNSRCFFIVKEDGSKHDISFHKCLSQVYLLNKNKKIKDENKEEEEEK